MYHNNIKPGTVQSGTKHFLVLLLLAIFFVLSFMYNVTINYNVTTTRYYTSIVSHVTKLKGKLLQTTQINITQNNTNHQKKLCPLPKLDPFSPQMMSIMNQTIMKMNYSCREDPALGIFKDVGFHVEKGNHLIRDVKLPDGIKCCYRKIERVDDEKILVVQKCHQIENKTTKIPPPIELISVKCATAKDKLYYKDGFQILHDKPEVEERIRAYRWSIKLNNSGNVDNFIKQNTMSVIILGMDTTSQMHFERSMPLSKNFLSKKLSAIKLMGYNKVADNTLPNILPLLTGQFREELQKSCFFKNKTDKKWVISNCTYIWDNFAENGYRTSFFEDEIPISIFNLHYKNAFRKKPPTDYYWRPYGILMEQQLHFKGFCYGPRLHLQSLLDNVLATAEFFRNRRHFNFVFSTDLVHDHHSALPWGDKPLLEFLQKLHKKGLLNNTALFLVGDHGIRNRDNIEQAMIENRQPLAYIVLPPWFPRRFPEAFANLEWNAKNSVLSPFDLYKTFFDFMDLPRLTGSSDKWRKNLKLKQSKNKKHNAERGRSIFEISKTGRSCETAGIPYMWCLCRTRVPLRNDSFLAVLATETALAAVNRKVKDFPNCEKLSVGRILNASVMIPNEETFYKKPGCILIITEGNKTFQYVAQEMIKSGVKIFQDGNTCDEDIIIQVRFLGSPLDPEFKTTVHRTPSGTFSTPYDVIRSDWYSDKGHCVNNEFRPYCICKIIKAGSTKNKTLINELPKEPEDESTEHLINETTKQPVHGSTKKTIHGLTKKPVDGSTKKPVARSTTKHMNGSTKKPHSKKTL